MAQPVVLLDHLDADDFQTLAQLVQQPHLFHQPPPRPGVRPAQRQPPPRPHQPVQPAAQGVGDHAAAAGRHLEVVLRPGSRADHQGQLPHPADGQLHELARAADLAIVIGGTSAEYALKTAKLASAKYLDALPTEGSMPASARRSVYLIDRYCDPRSE